MDQEQYSYSKYKKEFKKLFPNASCTTIRKEYNKCVSPMNITTAALSSINTMSNTTTSTATAATMCSNSIYSMPQHGHSFSICNGVANIPSIGEVTMEANKKTTEELAVQELTSALRFALDDKDRELRVKFNLKVDTPKTIREMVQRIKDGQYNQDEKELDKSAYDMMYFDFFRTKPVDQTGYDSAWKKLQASFSDTLTAVKVLPPEKGLEELRKFKATVH